MLTYKIFLASSNELAADRVAMGDMVQEYNDRLVAQQKQVHFTLYKWEGGTISFADKRKQAVYNDNIETSHLFALLYETKVGIYTAEEYDFAYNRFKLTKSPAVIVFKKETTKPIDASLKLFEDKIGLGGDEQFRSSYTDAASLKVQFFDELQKLFAKGFLKYGATDIYNDGQSVPANFIGRDDELKTIKEKLKQGGKLMLINAEGGIGKTTLAAKYWQESQADYDHRAWLFCENGIISELKKLAPPLNIDLSNMTEEEQLVNLKAGLQNVSHRFLLVLDNANTPEDIEAFKQNFRGFQWHVLITSRCKGVAEHSTEYEEYVITTLPPQQAKALFISNYKEDTLEFDALLDRLLIAINYHTLLVEIFSKNLKEASELGMTLTTFLEKLEANGLYLKKDSFEIPSKWSEHNQHKEWNTTDAILDALYDFTQLAANEVERYVLVNIALLPAVPFTLLFLAEILDVEEEYKKRFRGTLKSLTHKGWLSFDKKEYRISPIVQQLTVEKNKASLQADSKKLIDSLNKKLENDGTYLKHLNEAKPYVAIAGMIVKHLIKQPFYELSLLSFNSIIYLFSIGNLTEAVVAIHKDVAMSETIGDRYLLAISICKLGDAYAKMGQFDKTLENYRKCNKLYEELYWQAPNDERFINGLAISLEKLGGIYENIGELGIAHEHYRNEIKLFEEMSQQFPNNVSFENMLSISLSKLGGVYEKMTQLDKALEYYNKRNKISSELCRKFPGNVSFKNGLLISFERLGGLYRKLGELDKALEYYEDRNKISEELYSEFPSDVSFKNAFAVSYTKLASIYLQKNDITAAKIKYEAAAAIWMVMAAQYPQYAEFSDNLQLVKNTLKELGDYLNGLPDC